MIVHLLSGFLGSGKTTAIRQASSVLLKKGMRVGVITNDQGIKLVDGYFFRNMGIPERRVGNGCFCCNYQELDNNISSLIETNDPDVIFAESVGSCTDIVATVFKPLVRFRNFSKITLTTVIDIRLMDMIISEGSKIFDDDVSYIYFKQLEESEVIILNKADLTNATATHRVQKYLSDNYPGREIIIRNSLEDNESNAWLDTLETHSFNTSASPLPINYDTYASGEAKMGYLDQQFIVNSENGDALSAALSLIKQFVQKIRETGSTIGHVKFWLNERYKLSYTTTSDAEINIPFEDVFNCSLVVNARVQMDPEKLDAIMKESIQSTSISISENSSSFFKPGYPKPLHRIAEPA
jgi:G3E family GTPase